MDKRIGLTIVWIASSVATGEIQQNLHNSDERDFWDFKDTVSSFLRPIFGLSLVSTDNNNDSVWISGRYNTWIFSLLASCVVGISGIVPLIVISAERSVNLKKDKGTKTLRLLLSFAVGGLLGDVFLHLLPEAWSHLKKTGTDCHTAYLTLGLWILLGILTFIIIEMMFLSSQIDKGENITFEENRQLRYKKLPHISENGDSFHQKATNGVVPNGCINTQSNHSVQSQSKVQLCTEPESIQIAGYLNLMANSIDNFTHGLAVSGSFLVGTKMGILTTLAILMHEIPHEVGDFAILLRSGFNRWDAAKAQISTAGVGILGAVVALSVDSSDSLGDCTAWILPFTSGGFINIALVSVLPDIMKEEDPWESLKQIGCLCSGIAVMGLVSILTV